MKGKSCVVLVCVCVAMGFAQDESSPNAAGGSTAAAPVVSMQPQPSPQRDRLHAANGDNELFAAFAFPVTPLDSCSDSIANCNDPVKYLGADGDCACFTCDYGKTTQHNVCTNNKNDKDTLFKRARH